jgi:hypothetical protein
MSRRLSGVATFRSASVCDATLHGASICVATFRSASICDTAEVAVRQLVACDTSIAELDHCHR